ncbi:MAG: mechanosensitive ion channel family protein [Candidatus Altiarchaeota archaeon]|nr:mechanosensitive ion channel family protein [Candidatus Altiarchaeota archaeon]
MANVVDFSGLGFGTYILQQNILTAFAVFFLSILALRIFRGRVISLIKKLAEKTKSNLDDLLIALVERIPWTFYVLVSAYLSISFLVVPQVVTDVLWYAIVFVIVYYGIRATYIFIDHFRDQLIERRIQTDPKEDVSFIRLLANIVKYSMWVVGGLLILANMKIDISALLAGMGVGGIAIALAAQNVFEDIFSSFSIYFDKPFRIGDFIIIGDDMGVVDKIGVKTTRIKTLRGEELVVSNREMTSTRIHNFGKMPHRRIDFKFGVTYQTPVEKMKKIPQMVR